MKLLMITRLHVIIIIINLQHHLPSHEFDNPVYESGNGEGMDTTYSLLSDPSTELYMYDTVTDWELQQ